jgi:hypothetical protein
VLHDLLPPFLLLVLLRGGADCLSYAIASFTGQPALYHP